VCIPEFGEAEHIPWKQHQFFSLFLWSKSQLEKEMLQEMLGAISGPI
jgi:hypothetical protein